MEDADQLSEHLWENEDAEVSDIKVGVKLMEKRLEPAAGMLTAEQLLSDKAAKMLNLYLPSGRYEVCGCDAVD